MPNNAPAILEPAVAARFAGYPEPARGALLQLRGLIFDVAASTPGVGSLTECLKWGQPAYLTAATNAGTTIRLGVPKQGGCAIYTHCQTSLISDFRQLFPQGFKIEGNRAVHLDPDQPLPLDALRLLVHAALTYHLPAPPPRPV